MLVLELRPPEQPTFEALLERWPTWLSYAVSYLFIAIVWANHHYLLRYAREATPRLMWFNFAHLFSVSLLPLSTASMAVSRLSSQPVAFYAAVLHQAFAEYQSLYTAEAFAITTPTPAEIEQRWNEGPIWSVVKDGRLVGTVAAVAKNDALYIRSMAVVPSARGQGIGKILLVAVENFARAGGFQRMLLSTTPFLDDAIRLYQRFGFERIREGPHDLAGTPLFTMEKAVR